MILSSDNFQSSSAEGHPLTVYFKLPVSEISEIDDHKSVSKHIIIQSFILKQKSSLLRLSLLAPSGALIAIPTYYWSTHHPTFSDHTGPQHWTFTFWATTAI